MIKKFVSLIAVGGIASLAFPASAHEVWVERDSDNLARIYLGEPAQAMPEGGDPEFHHLQKPQIISAEATSKPSDLVRRADHIEAHVASKGDVRVRDDAVFEPWQSGETMQGVIYYARAGRSETSSALDFELVPVAAHADSFTLVFRGKPLPNAPLNVITPDRWEKGFVTDANGQFEVPQKGPGRYIVGMSHTEEKPAKLSGQDVDSVMHVSTLTFVR